MTYLESEKKGKIIEFDLKTIDLIEEYGKILGINTFSGVIRKMVSNELDRLKLNEDTHQNAANKTLSGLAEKEKQSFNEVVSLYKNHKELLIQRDKLKKFITNSKGKTFFERILLSYKPSDVIDELYRFFQKSFIKKGTKVFKVDDMISELKTSLANWDVDFNNISNESLYESISQKNIVNIIKIYDSLFSQENFKENHKNTVKSLLFERDIITDYKDNYNDVLESYYKYKNNEMSEYSMIRLLSEHIEMGEMDG